MIELFPAEFNDFIGGRSTDSNLIATDPSFALIAKQIIFLGDGEVRKMPGYTLVRNIPGAGRIKRIFDFQRDSDQAQFVFVQHDQQLDWINADGSGNPVNMSTGEDPVATFDFVQNFFNLYANNGFNAYKFQDNAGTLTKYKWGIAAPLTAPTTATGAGSLTLTYGRQYCYCYVSKIADSLGNTKIHIGPPSPLSAHTGPQTSKVITVGSLLASADPQVTHIWIFSTVDTPLDTTSVFYFNGEIVNGVTSYGDTLADAALDTTRLAPFENFPAPQADILLQYQSRIIALKGSTVFASGFEEIDLGIPEEAWPASLFFEIPGGKHTLTGGAVVDNGLTLMLSTEDFWFEVKGYSADTFFKQDRVISPGAIGKKAIATFPGGMAYVGPDKKLWTWFGDGSGPAIEVSKTIFKSIAGSVGMNSLSMEDLSEAQLQNSELKYFSWGRYRALMLFASTSQQAGTGAFDWVQVWMARVGDVESAFGLQRGQILALMESDLLPVDLLGTCAAVEVSDTRFLFFGDFSSGNIYRWPDGFKHNAQTVRPVLGTVWTGCDAPKMPNSTKRFYWTDCYTDRAMTLSDDGDGEAGPEAFEISGVVSDGPNMSLAPIAMPASALPSAYGKDNQIVRGKMNVKGLSVGKMARIIAQFPDDDNDAVLRKIVVSSTPIYTVNP